MIEEMTEIKLSVSLYVREMIREERVLGRATSQTSSTLTIIDILFSCA
jgi:hypothetical protein